MSKNRAEIYRLKGKTNFKDITEQLSLNESIPAELKAPLISGERKIVIFKYLSDGHEVARYFSYLTNQKQNPTLIFLRGGNKFFGLMRPNNRFSFLKGYTMHDISSLSGYLLNKNANPLIFSIIINGINVLTDTAKALEEQILELINSEH